MKKANIEKLQTLAQDFLQYRWMHHLNSKNPESEENTPDFLYYCGACDMIQAIGGEWKRFYNGTENDEKALNSIENYSHVVWFPSDERCNKLNVDNWKL